MARVTSATALSASWSMWNTGIVSHIGGGHWWRATRCRIVVIIGGARRLITPAPCHAIVGSVWKLWTVSVARCIRVVARSGRASPAPALPRRRWDRMQLATCIGVVLPSGGIAYGRHQVACGSQPAWGSTPSEGVVIVVTFALARELAITRTLHSGETASTVVPNKVPGVARRLQLLQLKKAKGVAEVPEARAREPLRHILVRRRRPGCGSQALAMFPDEEGHDVTRSPTLATLSSTPPPSSSLINYWPTENSAPLSRMFDGITNGTPKNLKSCPGTTTPVDPQTPLLSGRRSTADSRSNHHLTTMALPPQPQQHQRPPLVTVTFPPHHVMITYDTGENGNEDSQQQRGPHNDGCSNSGATAVGGWWWQSGGVALIYYVYSKPNFAKYIIVPPSIPHYYNSR
ncbi:hypothetical protein EDB89DRAFT_1906546 [Lactarius sanguifluus]|nr:hypothetical protein EDB89DRAFT_1906546 [Lactarius sanguifluus]